MSSAFKSASGGIITDRRRQSLAGRTGHTLARSIFSPSRSDDTAEEPGEHPKPGDQIHIEDFDAVVMCGGNIVTLTQLMSISIAGIVLFTYPKAFTPGCVVQACEFRDRFQEMASSGFSVYGVSRDSPTDSQNLKQKYGLPYGLICDQKGSLIDRLGLGKAGSATTRGVVAINKDGRVVASAAGGPRAGVEAVAPVIKAIESLELRPLREFGSASRGHKISRPELRRVSTHRVREIHGSEESGSSSEALSGVDNVHRRRKSLGAIL